MNRFSLSLVVISFFCQSLFAQKTFTFTNCGSTGTLGPTQSQVNSTYGSTNTLHNKVTIRTRGIQEWVVPTTGPYRIDVRGAEGGRDIYTSGNQGGKGARMVGEFNLTAGQTIKIVVGQKGGDTRFTSIDNAGAGGGGGSFVWRNSGTQILIAAGGGGGASSNTGIYSGIHGNTGVNGSDAQGISNTGGLNGQGARRNTSGSSYWAGGGCGWLSDGTGGNNPTNYNYLPGSRGAYGGRSPRNAALGGTRWNDGNDEGGDGGFGGGGGGGSDNMGAGGGGGYSGGGGARGGTYGDGGGGGSYNAGSNKSNSAAWNSGHGRVIITQLFGVDVTQTDSILCFGDSTASLTAQVSGGNPPYRFIWSTGDTTFSGQSITGYTLLGHRGTHSYYRRNSQTSSYTVASNEAKTYFGYLASITSTSENSWLWSNGAQSGNYIGLTDKDVEGTFVWDSGEAFSYSNWASGEPNNSGNEDFVQLVSSGRWNDIPWGTGTNRLPLIELPGASTLKNLAAGTYTVTVTDNGGNSINTSFTVVQPADINITSTVTDVVCFGQTNGSISNSVSGGVGPYTYSWSNGSSTKSLSGLSAGNFSLTVTDDNSCEDSVTISVNQPSLIIPSITLIRGESCNGQNDGSLQVDSTYTQYSWSNGQTSKTAVSLGAGGYRVTVTNGSGCNGVASDTVPLNDTIAPTIVSLNSTLYLNASGTLSIVANDVASITDNCSISATSLSKQSFSCADTGSNTITVRATDNNSLTDSLQVNFTVLDTIKPVVRTKTVNVYLDSSGQFSISPSMVDNGSFDNCSISTMSLSQSTFTCVDLGGRSTTLRVSDSYGNTDSSIAGINVLDTIKPVVVVKNINVFLNDSGNVVVKPSDVDSATSDNCSISSYMLSRSRFTCSDTGVQRSIFSAVDRSGNTAVDTVLITILDTTKPHLQARNGVEIYLDSLGTGNLTLSEVDSLSFDNCGFDTLYISPTSFDCSHVGLTNIYLIGNDQNGNSDSISVNVEVKDTVRPDIICPKDLSICEGILDYDDPQITDNCIVNFNNISGPKKGDYLSAGNYSVTFAASDQSANLSECSMAVKVNPLPQIFLGSDTALGLNAVLNLSAGHPDKDILWSTGDTTDSISVLIKLDTIFSVEVKDSNMCVGVDTLRVSFITDFPERIARSFKVFPNPSTGQISLVKSNYDDVVYLNVIDMAGREIKSVQIIDQKAMIDLSNLSSGTYFLSLISASSERLYKQKLIITR